MTVQDIKRIIDPLYRRIQGIVARAIIKNIDDSEKMQKVQIGILKDEIRDDVDRVQQYGFTSCPKPGADAVVIFVGGNRDHGIVIATDDARYRFKSMADGEVALYTDEGDYIQLSRGKIIKIKAQTKLQIDTPELTVTGKITAQGIIQGSEIKNSSGTKLGTHMHPTAASGPPSPPTPGS
jgi:phage gp45-like